MFFHLILCGFHGVLISTYYNHKSTGRSRAARDNHSAIWFLRTFSSFDQLVTSTILRLPKNSSKIHMPYHNVMQIREEGCRLVALCGRKKHCGLERSTLSVVHGILDTIYSLGGRIWVSNKDSIRPTSRGHCDIILSSPTSIFRWTNKMFQFYKNSRRSPWTGSCCQKS